MSRTEERLVPRLRELAERIIYRRDQAVGEAKRQLLADDANLIDEVVERLQAAEAERDEAIRGQYRGPVIYGSEAEKVRELASRHTALRGALGQIAEEQGTVGGAVTIAHAALAADEVWRLIVKRELTKADTHAGEWIARYAALREAVDAYRTCRSSWPAAGEGETPLIRAAREKMYALAADGDHPSSSPFDRPEVHDGYPLSEEELRHAREAAEE